MDWQVSFSFLWRFPIKWQSCVKMGKWNQHTSSFHELRVKQCKTFCGNYNFMAVIMYFACKVGFILFCQKMGSAAGQEHCHSSWLHLSQFRHSWAFIWCILPTATTFKSAADWLGLLLRINATYVQWWVFLYLNRFAFII